MWKVLHQNWAGKKCIARRDKKRKICIENVFSAIQLDGQCCRSLIMEWHDGWTVPGFWSGKCYNNDIPIVVKSAPGSHTLGANGVNDHWSMQTLSFRMLAYCMVKYIAIKLCSCWNRGTTRQWISQ